MAKRRSSDLSVRPHHMNLIGWKKLRKGVIAQLRISEVARIRSYAGKYTADRVEVVALFDRQGVPIEGPGESWIQPGFFYPLGAIVEASPAPFSSASDHPHGISFFLTREEAEKW